MLGEAENTDARLLKLAEVFSEGASPIQAEIFRRWLFRVADHYAALLPDPDHLYESDFLLKKITTFFFPYYSLIRSPFHLPDMETAVELLRHSFHKKENGEAEKIVIYGDRDVDGIASSSTLYLFLVREMGFAWNKVVVMLPREEDKYGITPEVCERILEQQPDLLFTLDCGSSNRESFAYLKEKNPQLKTVIIDHHFIPESPQDYPAVDAFINPKRTGITAPEHELCTSGIALKLIWSLTLSYTSEYGKIYRLLTPEKNIYLRNGVPLPAEEASETENGHHRDVHFGTPVSGGDAEAIDGRALWKELAERNVMIGRLDTFSRRHPGMLSDADRFHVIQHLRFIRVFEKIKKYFSIAAVGTVADLMPLVDDNRIFVSFGLKMMKEGIMPLGLRELTRIMGLLSGPLSETDLSFTICPALNAPGRLGKAEESFKLLSCSDPLEAAKAAFTVKQFNEERKKVSREAADLISRNLSDEHRAYPIAVVYVKEIHRGISGLVAGKLAEQLGKPAIVLVEDGDCLRGSARACVNEDVFSLLKSVENQFIQFGGHRQAAGFSLAHDRRESFTAAIYQSAIARPEFFRAEEKSAGRDFHPPLKVRDREIISRTWQEWLSFAPYGVLNPHPVVEIETTSELDVSTMGEDAMHARVNFRGISENSIEGVWFFHGGNLDGIRAPQNKKILAEPHLNQFAGKLRYQLKIRGVSEQDGIGKE